MPPETTSHPDTTPDPATLAIRPPQPWTPPDDLLDALAELLVESADRDQADAKQAASHRRDHAVAAGAVREK
jgi:hypothetical protein